MAKQPDKLTRRQIDNHRAKASQHVGQLIERVIKSSIGEPVETECKCGEKHTMYEDSTQMSMVQLNGAKLIMQKVFPDVSAEDFATVVDEPPSLEKNIKTAATVLANGQLVKGVVKSHVKEAIACRDLLNELLPAESKVTYMEHKA